MSARRFPSVAVAMVALLGVAGSVASEPQEPVGGEQPFLLALPGDAVVVNYSPGSLDRAYHVQRRFALLTTDVSRWSDRPLRLRIFVLGREEWSSLGLGLPYGLPGRLPGGVLAVPAAGDDGTVALWTRLSGAPPPALPGRPLVGTSAEASSLALSDLLAEVEAARALLAAAEVRGETAWVHQVLAHLVALTAFERYEAARVGEIGAFFASLGHGVDGTPSLADYRDGLDLATLVWFESAFHDGARRLLAAGKKNEVKKLLKLARKNGGVLTRSALLTRHPELGAWVEESFAAASAPRPSE